VAATIRVNPGGRSTTADADGRFELDVDPGTFELEISAPGYTSQTRTVRVTHAPVILKIDLRPAPDQGPAR
jgi:hypothetical protein